MFSGFSPTAFHGQHSPLKTGIVLADAPSYTPVAHYMMERSFVFYPRLP